MINVEVATILHFTQVIYQITRHSVLSDIYIWNIVSWQLEHIHSRLNTYQKCTTRLEYSLSGSARLVNFFGHDQRHV